MLSNLITMLPIVASDTQASMDAMVQPIVDLIDSLLTPALAIVGSVGVLYCILLGVKFAKAEEMQEHEKAKKHLKNAIIGFVLIFILMYALKVGSRFMLEWYETNAKVG